MPQTYSLSRCATCIVSKQSPAHELTILLTPHLKAMMLAPFKHFFYDAFRLNPKKFCDAVKGAYAVSLLWSDMKLSKSEVAASYQQKVYNFQRDLYFSSHIVLKKFALRIFGMMPSEVLQDHLKAQDKFLTRFPTIAPMLLSALPKDKRWDSDACPLWLVFSKTDAKSNAKKQRQKATPKSNAKKQRQKATSKLLFKEKSRR